jgi:hypothetical protein
MAYTIKTVDGAVVRKTASRPYVEALVYRYTGSYEVFFAELMASKAKHFHGQIEKEGVTYKDNKPFIAKWETVIAVEKGGK